MMLTLYWMFARAVLHRQKWLFAVILMNLLSCDSSSSCCGFAGIAGRAEVQTCTLCRGWLMKGQTELPLHESSYGTMQCTYLPTFSACGMLRNWVGKSIALCRN